MTTITSSPGLDPANNEWAFAEVWMDAMLTPPYLLLLLSSPSGSYHIYDPAEHYKLVFSCASYEEAQAWLLEDEYEPVEGKVLVSDL
ncbi:hypothetical protein [Synechococcus sp. PCC 6312]|uniref:hypothetical protein n=1 Tax=Synechococcus sp. (strain ATCC 27167 / PCC 6312) TaxID=195253 RepID=UPI00059D5714|nr:hypothetical protein [Synechococcus sp. PCC 6312]